MILAHKTARIETCPNSAACRLWSCGGLRRFDDGGPVPGGHRLEFTSESYSGPRRLISQNISIKNHHVHMFNPKTTSPYSTARSSNHSRCRCPYKIPICLLSTTSTTTPHPFLLPNSSDPLPPVVLWLTEAWRSPTQPSSRNTYSLLVQR